MTTEEQFQTLDALFAAGDFRTAEAKLTGWIDQAERENRPGELLSLYNELEGLYRTTGRAEQAVEISRRALALVEDLGLTGTIHHATTLINGATANTVLGRTHQALEMYRQAMELLEGLGQQDSYQMAALCQNISHCCQQLGDYGQALAYLRRALDLVGRFETTRGEVAATHTSMALCLMALGCLEEAADYLEQSLAYYESEAGAGDGHYASALAAAGELSWRRGELEEAAQCCEKALAFNRAHFGQTHSSAILEENLEKIRRQQRQVEA